MLTVINLQESLAYSTSINRKENRVGGWAIVSRMGPQPSQAAIMRDREGVQVTHHPSQAYAWEGCTAWMLECGKFDLSARVPSSSLTTYRDNKWVVKGLGSRHI